MYTDTNSLIYHTECDDAYETMKHNIARFDEQLSGEQRVQYTFQQKSTRSDEGQEQWCDNDRIQSPN